MTNSSFSFLVRRLSSALMFVSPLMGTSLHNEQLCCAIARIWHLQGNLIRQLETTEKFAFRLCLTLLTVRRVQFSCLLIFGFTCAYFFLWPPTLIEWKRDIVKMTKNGIISWSWWWWLFYWPFQQTKNSAILINFLITVSTTNFSAKNLRH